MVRRFPCLIVLLVVAASALATPRAWSQTGRPTTGGGGRTSQAQTQGMQAAPASSAAVAVDVTGRVLNGRTRRPIARALVQLGGRRVLTDRDGVFHLPQVSSASGSFWVMKPGFFPETDTAHPLYSFPSDAPIELMLYPEAILSGTAIDTTGEVVPHLSVVARGSTYNETGHHWSYAGRTQTLSDGSFRLSLPAGVYALQAVATGRPLAGTDVLQSVSVPANPLALNEAIRLAPGDQVRIDLRPAMRRAYDVTLHLERGPERGFPVLTARPASGPQINLGAVPDRDDPGTFHFALPSGTYEIFADLQSRDGRQQGRTSVTVAGRDVAGVQMTLAPVPVIPVVVEVESGATSDNGAPAPNGLQLGLTLASLPTAADLNDQVFSPTGGGAGRGRGTELGAGTGSVVGNASAAPSFSLPDGSYRFHARADGPWYVTAASCGGTDLLQQNLTLIPGSGGAELRVRVSNRTADLTGSTSLAGAPAAAWVYLVASTPSATPIVSFRSGSGGSFTRPYLAPGSYRAVALEHQVSIDLQNAEVFNRLGARVQTLTVSAGDHATLTLNAVPAAELAP